ncbi:MAG: hypothetical protein FWD60_05600 [Candidatus Azobacteroides sp.]|nr:hypothetical protein [Candidatus Azobacteroides sp.]
MNDFSKIGYEYGVKPYMILVGDIDYANYFVEAKCLGLLYMFRVDCNDNHIPAQIAFMFQNEAPAKIFFDCLMNWIERSNNDGDAVSIEFIENDKGGYTVAISPEMKRFIDRNIPAHLKDKISPLMMVQTQFKEIDSVSPSYQAFKANYKKAGKIAVGYVIGNSNKIEKQSDKYFIKTEFNFHEQDNIPQNSSAKIYDSIQKNKTFDKETLPKPPKKTMEQISARRNSEIKTFFPVTYNQLYNQGWLSSLVQELNKKYERDIIIQAICNLILFERLKQEKDLSADFTKAGYPTRILDYLISTFESFSSYFPADDFFTLEKVENQIKNDQYQLNEYLKK